MRETLIARGIPRFHSTVEVKILKFFKTASLVIATVTLSGMPIASAAAAPDSSRTPSLPIVSQTNDSGLIAEAEKEAGKANGAPSYAAQSTPRGEVEIAVTRASFLQQEDGTVAVVADSGERVETLPKEYTFEDGESAFPPLLGGGECGDRRLEAVVRRVMRPAWTGSRR